MNEFLDQLLHTHSVSGCEQQSREVITGYANSWASSVTEDGAGNVVIRENPDDGGIMLAAHMDEIGLMVNYITDDGMLHVCKVGGICVPMYFGHIVRVHTRNGILYGSVSVKRALYKEDAKPADILIDIGASSREEAAAKVEIGDFITFDSDCHPLLGNRICGRALDDKTGVYVITEALRRAKERGLQTSVSAVTTVGEETTQDGARWAAARLKPKLAVIVDVTYTSDYSNGSKPEDYGDVRLGNGPVIGIYPIIKRKNIDLLKQIAADKEISVQYETSGSATCTDGDKVHLTGEGVEVLLVSVPLRYMHSPCEVADLGDLENCIELIAEFLLRYPG